MNQKPNLYAECREMILALRNHETLQITRKSTMKDTETENQITALQKFADQAKLESIKLRNGLLEAKAGLEFAIRAIQGQGHDWTRSTPRLALEAVNEALSWEPEENKPETK